MSATLSAFVCGIGVWTPALPSWAAARDRLRAAHGAAGDALPPSDGKPPPASWLPPNERRRATLGTRLVLSVAQDALTQAGWNAADVPSVFASSSGSPEITDQLCAMLAAGDTEVSPTKFHNSVHNAAAGYYGIAVACRRASTSVGAHDASAGTGLLEALAQLADADASGDDAVLFVSFDVPYTGPLADVRPIDHAWGVALALARRPSATAIARVDVRWRGGAADETPCTDTTLDALRTRNPTARLLPLLETLATARAATVTLAAANGAIVVDVAPCSGAAPGAPASA